tara:strand:+ start:418 stop:1281 length:864 start_codon:yes stop_codon:yes gene_type:complete
MIIWIASYPKSGNTWLRSIISALVYSDDGIFDFNLLKKIQQFPEKKYFKDLIKDFSNFDEIKKNWIFAQDKINLDNKIKFFKTHQGKYTVDGDDFTNNINTRAVIYVVRDPRNVINSISNHYSLSVENSLKFMLSPKLIGNGKNFEESFMDNKPSMFTLLGKWNDHYRSWTRNKKNLLLIKYENLIRDPKIEMDKIIHFLNKYLKFDTSIEKNKNIIETTSFEYLKKLEGKGLFKEAPLKKNTAGRVKFFNLGPKNQWAKESNQEIIKSIEKNFSTEMRELGYLKQI